MYNSNRVSEMINGSNKKMLEYRRDDLRHRGFVWDGLSEALGDGMSERWTKSIGHFVENGKWVVTIVAHAPTKDSKSTLPKHLEYHVKIELDIPNEISHDLAFILARLGHDWCK